MSDVVARETASRSTRSDLSRAIGSLWLVALLSRMVAASRSAQRGLVTVEFIFGIILVIAIITVVVSVIHNPAIGQLLVQLVSWLLGLVKGVKA